MNKIFDINYNTLVRWLVPVPLRKPVMLAWLQALVWPVVQLYQAFRKNRAANLYRLAITPQVCYLEKMLNDRFDPQERRIRIDDTLDKPPVYLYIDAENKPVYLGSKPLYRDTEFGLGLDDFLVMVPNGLVFEMAELRGLVMIYKLASMRFSVQYF
jgi:hypothetical protein